MYQTIMFVFLNLKIRLFSRFKGIFSVFQTNGLQLTEKFWGILLVPCVVYTFVYIYCTEKYLEPCWLLIYAEWIFLSFKGCHVSLVDHFQFHLSRSLGGLLGYLSRSVGGLVGKHWLADLVSRNRDPFEVRIFSIVNGVLLHTSFRYHPPVVLIWLKYY